MTDEQKTYLIGKEYEARKMTQGSTENKTRDANGKFSQSVQSGNSGCDTGKTAQKVADAHNIGYGTVIRAEQFTHGLDAADVKNRPGFPERLQVKYSIRVSKRSARS